MKGDETGISHATAHRLAAERANVIVNYSRSKEGALEVGENIVNDGGVALPYRADVSKECEILDMFTHTIFMFGRIDFLVNNTSNMSQIPRSELNEVTEKVWNSLFAVNVKSMFHCVKTVFPYMKKQSAVQSSISGA